MNKDAKLIIVYCEDKLKKPEYFFTDPQDEKHLSPQPTYQ
jgi:hypothetical protein